MSQPVAASNPPTPEPIDQADRPMTSRRPKPIGALDALAETVKRTHRAFSKHVEHQEGPCGFLAFTSTAAPRYLTMLEHLRAEHRHLAGAVASLRLRVRRGSPAQWEALAAESDAVTAAIAEHESLERELLVDALEAP